MDLGEPLDDLPPEGEVDYLMGKKVILERIYQESLKFEDMMRKRRFRNNANGVVRFREYLKTVIPEAKNWPS